VRAVHVVVLHKLLQHFREVVRSGDQEVVKAFPPQGADCEPAGAPGPRTGCGMVVGLVVVADRSSGGDEVACQRSANQLSTRQSIRNATRTARARSCRWAVGGGRDLAPAKGGWSEPVTRFSAPTPAVSFDAPDIHADPWQVHSSEVSGVGVCGGGLGIDRHCRGCFRAISAPGDRSRARGLSKTIVTLHRRSLRVGDHEIPLWGSKPGYGCCLRLQAARSYSLMSPPRTGRRLIRWWSRRGAG
jgi:hypothetical protein